MFSWFISLPLGWKIATAISALLVGVLFTIFGKATIVTSKFGKKIILGKRGHRSCGDCILILFAKRERLESRKRLIENSILKDQMNFVEQKLLEVNSLLVNSYRESLCSLRSEPINLVEENKQLRLYQALLKNALILVKDEVRRSCKENGFESIGGTEFSSYIKNKVNTLVSIGKDYIVNLYPYEGMIVPIEERLKNLEKVLPKLEDFCFDTFIKAKEIRNIAKKQLEVLDKDFADEIDEMIGEK